MSELLPRPGPMSLAHAEARRLAQEQDTLPFRADFLYGKRGIKRPMVAITTKQNLGPCRHALAQMIVAGTMTVHPPLRPGQAPPTPEASGPRVLTFTPPPREEERRAAPPAPAPRAAPPAKPASPPPAAATGRPAGPRPGLPSGAVVTYERKVLEDFNPSPDKDE